MSQVEKIAEQAYKHYKNCSSKYDNGHIWNGTSGNIMFMRNIIEDANLREDAVNLVQKADLFNIYSSEDKINKLREEWNLSNGSRERDLNSGKSILYLNRIESLVGKISTILEIGVGIGNMAVYSNVPYIGIDIPETLFFAYINCCEKFPNRKVVWLEKEEDLEDYNILFIPLGKEHLLNGMKFDLAINTCSFGELSSNFQKHWIDFLENKVELKYFYSLNRFLNIIGEDHFGNLRKNENSYNMSFNNKWGIKSFEAEPEYTRCPYEDSRAARCVEILFDCKRIDNSIFDEDILEEDFMKLEGRYILGTLASHPLRTNLSKSGTLFKLWNNYRINKNKLDIFHRYLRYIGDSKYKFEEEYYGI